MSVGKMQHRLTIQSPKRTADGGGGSAITWEEVDTVWGRITGKSGSESFFGDQLEGRSSHEIIIRFRRGITNKHRLIYSYEVKGKAYSRTFNVNRVQNKDEKDRYLVLYCSEGVAT